MGVGPQWCDRRRTLPPRYEVNQALRAPIGARARRRITPAAAAAMLAFGHLQAQDCRHVCFAQKGTVSFVSTLPRPPPCVRRIYLPRCMAELRDGSGTPALPAA